MCRPHALLPQQLGDTVQMDTVRLTMAPQGMTARQFTVRAAKGVRDKSLTVRAFHQVDSGSQVRAELWEEHDQRNIPFVHFLPPGSPKLNAGVERGPPPSAPSSMPCTNFPT
ncbi:MAG: hypothetical protein KatS3mg082_2430 [Nitrospiraceae bacterium]|nr:MAG: hypothetical protein KatS3mg082_2430 [Nitrospiraceae bacterium]